MVARIPEDLRAASIVGRTRNKVAYTISDRRIWLIPRFSPKLDMGM